jgi:hypothetical protein
MQRGKKPPVKRMNCDQLRKAFGYDATAPSTNNSERDYKTATSYGHYLRPQSNSGVTTCPSLKSNRAVDGATPA